MRKFLMVAAVVAVAACGKKQADTSAESMGAAAGAAVDTAAHVADSAMGAMADSAHAAMAPAAAGTTHMPNEWDLQTERCDILGRVGGLACTAFDRIVLDYLCLPFHL